MSECCKLRIRTTGLSLVHPLSDDVEFQYFIAEVAQDGLE